MKTYNYIFGIMAILLMATACGKDDEPSINPPVYSLQKSDAVVAVDLGLSVLWSNCNMGATSPHDYGGYFAWAEPTGALWSAEGINYDGNAYSWNTSNYGGNTPSGSYAGSSLDIATVNWGSGWHVPSYYEFAELIEKCEWVLVQQGSSAWVQVTGPNGNSIDMPLAGMYGDDDDNDKIRFLHGPLQTNTSGWYWTSSACWKQVGPSRGYSVKPGVETAWALIFSFDKSNAKVYNAFLDHLRAFHLSIRPVKDK